MPIPESLLLGLGVAIGNTLITLAAGDNKAAAELSKGALGAGKSWLEKARGQTEAAREMEAKGRRIAQAVIGIFERESDADEGAREAAVLAATDALRRADIDGALLTRLDLDPDALARHVLALRPALPPPDGAWRDGGADELTRRLVLAAGRHIIANGNLLPGFTSRLGREQLERLRSLHQDVGRLPGQVADTLEERRRLADAEKASASEARYRDIIARRAVIEVPGTGVVKPLAEAFLWPKASRYDRTRQADFDDETPRFTLAVRSDRVDLSLFPGTGLDRVVVIAGPGYGKSVLTLALAARAITRGHLPVVVPIPELSRLDVGIGDYLADHVNRACEVAIDWTVAADAGLLVLLLDGLDEVASDRRAVILDRIKTYAHRHPATPWLLTVRDAAALAAPTADALLVELEPLDDEDVARFVALYRPDDTDLPKHLSRRFEARPDVQRLARIPLFLAILLATLRSPDELPSNRTALLEMYLDLLFRPEQFKPGEPDPVDPTTLRPIAEAVAFEALEREGIGVDERLLQTAIRHHLTPGTSVQPLIERLIKCGVLRRAGPGQYVFPFPIIQEYLAACHILESRLDEVPERLPSAVKRPWAQALQFVLTQHPSPGPLVRDLLAGEDDAFHTQLRLVARCVANGMAVSPDMHQEIARRLALVWSPASWRLRMRIGELIVEAFCDPLVPEVRAQLSNRWLLHDGSGAIVARLGDRNLTRGAGRAARR